VAFSSDDDVRVGHGYVPSFFLTWVSVEALLPSLLRRGLWDGGRASGEGFLCSGSLEHLNADVCLPSLYLFVLCLHLTDHSSAMPSGEPLYFCGWRLHTLWTVGGGMALAVLARPSVSLRGMQVPACGILNTTLYTQFLVLPWTD